MGAGVLRAALRGVILSGALCAAGMAAAPTPPATLPHDEVAATPTADPASLLSAMADHLENDPTREVLRLDNLPVSQADIAAVIRSMPPGIGNQPYQKVFGQALDVMIRQKAMVRRAQMEHLDKDPMVIHKIAMATDLVLAEAWLRRRANTAVTEEALKARYEQEIAGKPGPDEVRARVILVPSESQARMLLQLLGNGVDFADLARANSTDPTAANGGDTGYVTREVLPPEVAIAMFSLAPGQVTAYPVPSSQGFLIIRVEGRQARAAPTFEEARPRLAREIRENATREATGSLLSNIKIVRPETPDGPARP